MELSYNDLRKREVINIADGRSLGKIIDLKLIFPEGRLIGIVVPGRNLRGIFKCFDKTQMYIEERKIVKIGSDVILVDIRCFDSSPRPTKPKVNPCGGSVPCGQKENISVQNFASQFENISEEDY